MFDNLLQCKFSKCRCLLCSHNFHNNYYTFDGHGCKIAYYFKQPLVCSHAIFWCDTY